MLMLPRAAGTSPITALHSVDLPMPLRPTTREHAAIELQVEALQRLHAAVVDVRGPDVAAAGAAAMRRGFSHAWPQVDRLHLGVVLDLVRRAFLEDAAVVHDGHALDHAQRDVEIVLDEDVADVGGQRPQERDQLAALGRREPGRRLVEEDEARRARERHADLELALLAVRQLGDRLVGDVRRGARASSSSRGRCARGDRARAAAGS